VSRRPPRQACSAFASPVVKANPMTSSRLPVTAQFSNEQGDVRDELYDYRGALLPIFSPLELVELADSNAEVMAELLHAGRFPTGHPSVVRRKLGSGEAWYFAFDLTQTLWVMHQGRPIDRDDDGDGYYRTGDAIPFNRLHNLEIPFGDYWLQLLEQIVTRSKRA